MIKLVISGGQTGVDQAGLKAARFIGIKTGGWAPKDYMTEEGPRAGLLQKYHLRELEGGYVERTKRNIKDADITLIIADRLDGGSKLTAEECLHTGKTGFIVFRKFLSDTHTVEETARKIKRSKHHTLNVAGNRESKSKGISQEAFNFLTAVFARVNS